MYTYWKIVIGEYHEILFKTNNIAGKSYILTITGLLGWYQEPISLVFSLDMPIKFFVACSSLLKS